MTPAAAVARLRAAGCVFAEEEASLLAEAASDAGELASLVERRAEGLPLEQLLGWAEFRGRRVSVAAGVFVPRRRTGFLVELALALAPRPAVVLDVCCGSGAIGAALAAEHGDVELHATDVDPAAVACARRNVTSGAVYEGDLFAPLPADLRGRVDVMVANAPYVPTDSVPMMPPEARLYEPLVALDGGGDGLDIQRRVIAGAPEWLTPGGSLLIETSVRQAPHTAEAFRRNGFTTRTEFSDELDATVVIGTVHKG